MKRRSLARQGRRLELAHCRGCIRRHACMASHSSIHSDGGDSRRIVRRWRKVVAQPTTFLSKVEYSMNDERMGSWPAMSTAVVVGAGGMGMAVARRLGQHHRLLLADINGEKLTANVQLLRDEGLWVEPVRCDLCDRASIEALACRIRDRGGFRVLAHVAGLSPSMADWRTIMQVNLCGAAMMADTLLPLATPGAAAIFISSLAAHMAGPSAEVIMALDKPLAPDYLERLVAALGEAPSPTSSYSLSKFALNRLCERSAWSWGQKRARIVSLSPGLIATPMGML